MHAYPGRPRPPGFVPGGLLALALLAPASARAACQVKFAELPVHRVGMRAMATVGINDQEVPLMDLLNFADAEYDLVHGMTRFVFPTDDCDNAVDLDDKACRNNNLEGGHEPA